MAVSTWLRSSSTAVRSRTARPWLGASASTRGRRGGGRVPEDRQLGEYLALSELGTGLFDFLPGSGAWLRARGRRGERPSSLPGLLAVWKDADPDIPILKQAQAEYA